MKKLHMFLLLLCAAVFVFSAVNPAERATWYMEVAPAVAGLAVLAFTYRAFKFTDISYILIAFFCCYIMIGGKYTYAEVPIGNYIKDIFDMSRNHYDRVGHFFQGVIPAVIARELLLRKTNLGRGKMLFFVCVCAAMFISASYEIIEWLAAELTAGGAVDFLGLQGDVWDAQKDMLMALLGSVSALLLLSKIQDKQMANL
jgi:putative membrane protein